MKRATFTLALENDRTIPWSGYRTDVPGLVVCRGARKNPVWGGAYIPADTWQIVHEASGWVIGKCRIGTRALAVIAAEAFGRLADWTRPIGDLAGDEALRLAIRAALKEVGL